MGEDPGGRIRRRQSGVFSVKLFRIVLRMLKLTVYACDALMTANLGIVVHGGHGSWVLEYVAGYSACGVVILITVSYLLSFCWAYRALVAHNAISYTLLVASRHIGLGPFLVPAERLLLVAGVLLLVAAPFLVRRDGPGEGGHLPA